MGPSEYIFSNSPPRERRFQEERPADNEYLPMRTSSWHGYQWQEPSAPVTPLENILIIVHQGCIIAAPAVPPRRQNAINTKNKVAYLTSQRSGQRGDIFTLQNYYCTVARSTLKVPELLS
jgi:hypothetical protein